MALAWASAAGDPEAASCAAPMAPPSTLRPPTTREAKPVVLSSRV